MLAWIFRMICTICLSQNVLNHVEREPKCTFLFLIQIVLYIISCIFGSGLHIPNNNAMQTHPIWKCDMSLWNVSSLIGSVILSSTEEPVQNWWIAYAFHYKIIPVYLCVKYSAFYCQPSDHYFYNEKQLSLLYRCQGKYMNKKQKPEKCFI